MARRKEHPHEELPFVALMDTMTNVVGVLIIVLVMIGIGLASSVNKVLSELPPVTPDQFAKLQQEVESAAPKHDPKKVDEENAKLQKDLTKTQEELKTLDVTKEKQQVKIVDLDELKKQLNDRQKQRDAKKSDLDKLLAEIDKLKAQLDTTPVYVPPPVTPATVVKLPNPRPMPQNADISRFLIAGGRIIFINDEEYARLVEQEIRNNESNLGVIRDIVKGPDGKPVMVKDKFGRLSPRKKTVYDSKKVADYFARRRLVARGFKLEVTPAATSPRIPVKITPTSDAGETVAQAKTLTSEFQRVMGQLRANPKAVVWFHVFKDSIPTYLEARDLVDQAGIPAGWELYGNSFFVVNLPPEFAVNYTPPKPPAAGAAPLVTIAPPKATLD